MLLLLSYRNFAAGPAMLRFAAAVIVISAIQLVGTQAAADYSAAEKWFVALPFGQRTDIQRSLTWTSGYLGFPDGAFGQRTFDALAKFDSSRNLPPDGILDQHQLQALAELAVAEQNKVRFS